MSPSNGPASKASSPSEHQNDKSKVCSYRNEIRKKISDHETVHFLRKCLNCSPSVIKKGTFSAHKRQSWKFWQSSQTREAGPPGEAQTELQLGLGQVGGEPAEEEEGGQLLRTLP